MNTVDMEAYVREKEPNICQICVWKDGIEIYSTHWNRSLSRLSRHRSGKTG